jgi:hypothetical protein
MRELVIVQLWLGEVSIYPLRWDYVAWRWTWWGREERPWSQNQPEGLAREPLREPME